MTGRDGPTGCSAMLQPKRTRDSTLVDGRNNGLEAEKGDVPGHPCAARPRGSLWFVPSDRYPGQPGPSFVTLSKCYCSIGSEPVFIQLITDVM